MTASQACAILGSRYTVVVHNVCTQFSCGQGLHFSALSVYVSLCSWFQDVCAFDDSIILFHLGEYDSALSVLTRITNDTQGKEGLW